MVDTAERYRQIRERLPLADRVDVPRDRENLALDADLVEWINENSAAGGWFRSHGDAVEAAFSRLRTERFFIEEQCRSRGVAFKPAAFWHLYKDDLQRLPPSVRGRPSKGEDRETNRLLVGATVAVELVAWANKTWLKEGIVERLAQVAEIGLRRLRTGGHRVDPGTEEPKLTLEPDKFWRLYQAAVAKVP